MIASRLSAVSGISPTIAKGIIVVVLGGANLALIALVQDGFLAGPWASVAPAIGFVLTGVAALVDPNASHA